MMERDRMLEMTREWFARIAAADPSRRFRADYGLFLDDPDRTFSLVDEALHLHRRLGDSPRRVLDAGCGFGVHSVLLSWAGCAEVVGMDPARSKIAESAPLAALASRARGVRFVQGDALFLPFAGGSFDAVLARESLSHVPQVAPALAEFHRVLASRGVLCVRDYNNRWGLPGRGIRKNVWKACEEGPTWDLAADPVPFAQKRRRILRKALPDLADRPLGRAVEATRGQVGAAVAREGLNFLGTGRVRVQAEFPYRDPETGVAEERVFSGRDLEAFLAAAGFESRSVKPRHFHAQKDGWRRWLAETREFLIGALHPWSTVATSLVECDGVKRATEDTGKKGKQVVPVDSVALPVVPPVAVVIPSRDGVRSGNVQALLGDVARQTVSADVEMVVGVSPCGRAHNEGVERVRRAPGQVLLFIDDDVRLGHERVVENLVRTLTEHPDVGICGASQIAPLDANPFQRSWVRQMPRGAFPVVDRVVDTDVATHAAMAIRRDLYEAVGGEPGDLLRADDQVLRARVREKGLRVVVAPDAWVFHPPPLDFKRFLALRLRDGVAASHDRLRSPRLLFDVPAGFEVRTPRARGLAYRTLRAVASLARDLYAGRWLPVAGRLAHGAGYAAFLAGLARAEVREAQHGARGLDRRPRLLFVGYAWTRFQEMDRELLSREFRVKAVDFREAASGRLRWWWRSARDLARSSGCFCWFADRHAAGLALLGRILGRRVVVAVGGYEVARLPEIGYGLSLTRRGRFAAARAMSLARAVVAHSGFMQRRILGEHRLPPGRVLRIPHGVFFSGSGGSGSGGSEPSVEFPRERMVLTIAQVHPVNLKLKGLATFLQAARLAPEWHWILAGPVDEGLRRQLLAGQSGNVQIPGFLPERDLVGLYRRACYYAQLSRFEGFGMALAEAMYWGCVPITTGAGGMPEVTGPLGRVVPPGDAAAVAAVVRMAAPARSEHEAAALRIREQFPKAARARALASLFKPWSDTIGARRHPHEP